MTSDFRISIFGLEIPFKVPVSMLGACANVLLLERNKELTEESYLKPKKEEILGSFHVPTEAPQALSTSKKSKKKP